ADSSAAGGARAWNPDKGVPKITTPAGAPVNYVDVRFNPVPGGGGPPVAPHEGGRGFVAERLGVRAVHRQSRCFGASHAAHRHVEGDGGGPGGRARSRQARV